MDPRPRLGNDATRRVHHHRRHHSLLGVAPVQKFNVDAVLAALVRVRERNIAATATTVANELDTREIGRVDDALKELVASHQLEQHMMVWEIGFEAGAKVETKTPHYVPISR